MNKWRSTPDTPAYQQPEPSILPTPPQPRVTSDSAASTKTEEEKKGFGDLGSVFTPAHQQHGTVDSYSKGLYPTTATKLKLELGDIKRTLHNVRVKAEEVELGIFGRERIGAELTAIRAELEALDKVITQ